MKSQFHKLDDVDPKALELKFFSVDSVAEILNVCPRTVRRWIKNGELVAHRIGGVVRIAESDLKDFIHRHRGK